MKQKKIVNDSIRYVWHPCSQMQNYDDRNLKAIRYAKGSWLFDFDDKKYFDGVYDYLELTIKGAHVVLMHYPIAEFHRKHYGSFHIHGHSHGSFIAPGRYMDVGIDTRPNGDMKLWHWDEVYNFLSNKPY